MSRYNKKGVVVLPTILIFGAIIVGMVLTGVFVVQLITRSNFGVRLAAETSAAAQAGVEDVYLRLLKGTLKTTGGSTNFTQCDDVTPIFSEDFNGLNLGRANVSIKVCEYLTQCSDPTRVCRYRVITDASALFVKRSMEAVFDVDQTTGQVSLTSLEAVVFD